MCAVVLCALADSGSMPPIVTMPATTASRDNTRAFRMTRRRCLACSSFLMFPLPRHPMSESPACNHGQDVPVPTPPDHAGVLLTLGRFRKLATSGRGSQVVQVSQSRDARLVRSAYQCKCCQPVQLGLDEARLQSRRPVERTAQADTEIVAQECEEGIERIDAVAFAAPAVPARAGGDVGDLLAQDHFQ